MGTASKVPLLLASVALLAGCGSYDDASPARFDPADLAQLADTSNLVLGRSYVSTRRVGLMPYREAPTDGSADWIAMVTTIEPGDRFTVLEVSPDLAAPWYKVRTDDGREGWINGVAFFNSPPRPGV